MEKVIEARQVLAMARERYVEERKRLSYDDPYFKTKVTACLNDYVRAIRPYFGVLDKLGENN